MPRLIAALERHGFSIVRVRGSHHFLKHADGRMTVVPVRGKETIGPGLRGKVLRDCELTSQQILSEP